MNNRMQSRQAPFRRFTTRTRLLTAAVSACFAASAFALPTGPVVVNGAASLSQAGNVLSVTNSNGAILNWQKFGIAANEAVRFNQSSASSSVLNRVVGPDPSQIFGQLTSNGRVWLINPAGILVGPSGRIDTAGFVASTLNVANQDFLAGRLNFQAAAGAGSVVNQGSIVTPAGGTVYLVGANVSNEGLISTPNGETILAAGQTVNLIDTATPGVKVEITGAAGNVTNLGEIAATAGRIGMAGVIVRNSGTLNASSVVNEGGRIFLKASQDTYVDGAGRIVATGSKGGQVEVLGNRVAVMDSASIDASGANGGGVILVGGDYQGKNADVQNATITYFGKDVALKADATDNGDGGKVIVWADDTTRAYGNISARGGQQSGNGGFVETSGHRFLDVAGIQVGAGASQGHAGTWLLDPNDISITNGTGNALGGPATQTFAPGTTSSITDGTINATLNGGADVVIQTTSGGLGGNGDITVQGGVSIATHSAGALSLRAYNDIVFDGTLGTLSGSAINFNNAGGPGLADLTLNLDAGHAITTTNDTTLNFGQDFAVSSYQGSVAVNVLNGKTWTNNGHIVLQGYTTKINLVDASNNAATFDNYGTLTLNSWIGDSDNTGPAVIQGSSGIFNNYGGIVDVHYGASIDAIYNQDSSGKLMATDINTVGNAQSVTLTNAGDISGIIDMSGGSNSDASRYPTFTIAGGTANIHNASIVLDANDVFITGGTVAFNHATIDGFEDTLAGYQPGDIHITGGAVTFNDVHVTSDVNTYNDTVAANFFVGNISGTATTTFTNVNAPASILKYGWNSGNDYSGSVTLKDGNSVFKSLDNSLGSGTLTLNNAILGLTDTSDFSIPDASVTNYIGNVGYVVAGNLTLSRGAAIDASGGVTLVAGWDPSTGLTNYGVGSVVGAVDLNDKVLASGDLIVLASGSITLNDPGSTRGTGYTIDHGSFANTYYSGYLASGITLLAKDAVDIKANVGNVSGTGTTTIMAGWDGTYTNGTPTAPTYDSSGPGIKIEDSVLFSTGSGAVTFKAANDIAITSASNYAGIDANTGKLDIAAISLSLDARNTSSHSQAYMARIVSNGDQSFSLGDASNAGVLTLHGNDVVTYPDYSGGGELPVLVPGFYGGGASIERYGSTTGGQKFTIYGGGSVNLTAGQGDGVVDPNVWSGDCAVGGCSDNYAKIEDHGGGGQTFDFVTGGSLTLTGGYAGTDNYARISSDGAQKLWSSTGKSFDITIQGGMGGGIVSGKEFPNDAGIISKISQDINTYGGALTMYGGGYSVSSSDSANTYGGAFLMAPTQSLSFGNVSLTGGYSDAANADGVGAPVVIGYKSGANIALDIAGQLNIAGGLGYSYQGRGTTSPVLIGSLHAAAPVSITTTGNVSITSGHGGVGIGSLSALDLTNGDMLGGVYIASGASITATGASDSSARSRIEIEANGDVYINGTVKSEGSYESTPQFLDYQYDPSGSDGIFIKAGKGMSGGNIALDGNSAITGDQIFLTALSQGYTATGNIGQLSGGSIQVTGGGGSGGYSAFMADGNFAQGGTITVAGTQAALSGFAGHNDALGKTLDVTNISFLQSGGNLYLKATGGATIGSVAVPAGRVYVEADSVYGLAASRNITTGVLNIDVANGIGGVNGLVTAVDRINSLSAGGDINIQNYGPLIVGPATVSDPLSSICSDNTKSVCGGGAVVIATHSPLTVNGPIDTVGSVSLAAGGGGTLTVAAGVPVSGSSVALAAGTFAISGASFFAGGDAITPTQTNNTPASGGGGGGGASTPTPPALDACVANPALSGCASVLPTLAICTTNPTAAGCSVVFPPVTNCTTNPTAAGCTPVLPTPPTLATCTANPTLAGCAAVLPTLATCATNPTASGCSVVLPPLATCATTPTLPGCSSVLPTLASCTTNPTAAGCSTVLPTLATCATTPTLAGCSAVLPPLASCAANPIQDGCSAVLPTTTDTTKQVTTAVETATHPTTPPPPVVVPPPATTGGSGGGIASFGGGTVGGGAGQFGGSDIVFTGGGTSSGMSSDSSGGSVGSGGGSSGSGGGLTSGGSSGSGGGVSSDSSGGSSGGAASESGGSSGSGDGSKSANGDKDTGKSPKSSNSSGGKKDEKPSGRKILAKCNA